MQRAPGRGRVAAGIDLVLALAVIAEPARLQDRGQTDLVRGLEQLRGIADRGIGRGGDPEFLDEFLFDQPVLGESRAPADPAAPAFAARGKLAVCAGTFSNS